MARRGYNTGWGYILDVWAGKRTVRMYAHELVTSALNLGMKLFGGRDAEIARAKGEMPITQTND
jgi:hypothetical protein